jgi:hypothetical protein
MSQGRINSFWAVCEYVTGECELPLLAEYQHYALAATVLPQFLGPGKQVIDFKLFLSNVNPMQKGI